MWLLIDDVRDLDVDIIARSSDAGCCILNRLKGRITHLCIDHDLGEDRDNGMDGYDIIKWAASNGFLPPHVQIVSSNPVGLRNISDFLISEGFTKAPDGRNFKR